VAARAPAGALSRQCFSVVSISCVVFIPNESMIRMLPSMEDRSQTDRVSEGQNRTSGVTNGGQIRAVASGRGRRGGAKQPRQIYCMIQVDR